MRGKILLTLAGLAALSVMFVFPPVVDAWRPLRQPCAMPWNAFWMVLFFRDQWGGGPTEHAKNKVLSASAFAIGSVIVLIGFLTVDIRLKLIGMPMAAYAAFAFLWLEHRKGVMRNAKLKEAKASAASAEEGTFEKIDIATHLLSGSPELNLIVKESTYDGLVEDLVQPYISILLSAPSTPDRDMFLTNIYAGIERVLVSQDPFAKQVILNGLLLGKGSWWWNTSLPFMGKATLSALEAEVPGWKNLQVGTMPGCFPYADHFGFGELLNA